MWLQSRFRAWPMEWKEPRQVICSWRYVVYADMAGVWRQWMPGTDNCLNPSLNNSFAELRSQNRFKNWALWLTYWDEYPGPRDDDTKPHLLPSKEWDQIKYLFCQCDSRWKAFKPCSDEVIQSYSAYQTAKNKLIGRPICSHQMPHGHQSWKKYGTKAE